MKNWSRNLPPPAKALLAGAGLGACALLIPVVVSAVAPPANTNIGNIAVASYLDTSGKTQSVRSNQVNTTVAQIGGFTLINDNTKWAASGNTVYMPHTLTNTGNGTDTFNLKVVDSGTGAATFSSISVFPDANGNGVPSGAAFCSPTTTPCSTGFTQLLTANGTFNFLVAYSIPGGASSPTLPFDKATVTASPITGTGIPYAQSSLSNLDTVNLSNGAAFTATKAIGVPSVSAPLGAAWPSIVSSGKASPASCPTTWSSTLISGNPSCTYTVYTIAFQNNGSTSGPLSLQDSLPPGMTFVRGSAVWSGNGGAALNDTAASGVTGTSPNTITSSFSAPLFKATIANVAPNVSGTISFVALINSTATVGTATTNNVAAYWSTGCDATQTVSSSNCGNASAPTDTTNPAPFTILGTSGVVAASSASTVNDGANGGTPPTKAGIDLVIANSVPPGGTVSFTNVITNTGNVVDTFNLGMAASGANNTFPAGTTFAFFKADGVTPLLDSNADGVPDTGPVQVGVANAVTIVVQATLPATTAPAAGVNFDALMTATSITSSATAPAAFDSVWERVKDVAIAQIKVDLTNTAQGNKTILNGVVATGCTFGSNCDVGQGPSANPTDIESTTPGVGALFPLFVKNNDTAAGTYNLTGSLPAGWTLKFVASGGTCSSAAVSMPLSIPATQQTNVVACVTAPAGTPVGTTTNISFKVNSTTDSSVTDSITDAVTLNAAVVKSLSLTPATGSKAITAGGTIQQPAILTNTGNASCGTATEGFDVSVALDSASTAAGWTWAVYQDVDGSATLTAADKLLAAPIGGAPGNLNALTATPATLVPLAPGQNIPLIVKLFAPSGATTNAQATAILQVVDTSSTQCPTQTAKYVVTVVNGQLDVVKTQAIDSACTGAATAFGATTLSVKPGQCISYQVVVTNNGATAVSNVAINDAAPTFTTLMSTPSSANTCTVVGQVAGSPVPSFTGNATNGSVLCAAGTDPGVSLNPQGTMTMRFLVQVQQ